MVVTDGSTLSAHRAADGTAIWRIDLGATISTAPALGATNAMVGLSSREVAVMDVKTGALVWRAPLTSVAKYVSTSPTSLRFFVALEGGVVCAHQMMRAKPAWCYPFHVPLAGAPLIQARELVVALFNNTVRTLDTGNGALRRQDAIGARPGAAPSRRRWVFWCRSPARSWGSRSEPHTSATRAERESRDNRDPADVFVLRDASAVATIAIAPGSRQTLALYKRVAPSPHLPTRWLRQRPTDPRDHWYCV